MDVHHRLPLLRIDAEDHPVAEDARVVHQDVEVTEGVDGLLHETFGRGGVGDVVEVGDRASPGRLDLGDDVLGRPPVAAFTGPRAPQVVHDDPCARRRERERLLAADAAPGTGDDRDLALEIGLTHRICS